MEDNIIRTHSTLLLVALLALFMACGDPADAADKADIGDSVDVEEILNAHFEAVGGLDRLSEIKTVKRSGVAQLNGAFGKMSGTIEEAIVVGKKWYSKTDYRTYTETSAWNGIVGWKSSSVDGTKPLVGNELEAAMIDVNIDPLHSIYTQYSGGIFEQLKDEKFQGKECTAIRLEGGEIVYYIDKASNLLVGLKVPFEDPNLGDTTVVIQFSDYAEYDGVMFPNSSRTIIDDGAITVDYTYTKTEIDVELDEKIFESKKIFQKQ
jgi:hypothetical protein